MKYDYFPEVKESTHDELMKITRRLLVENKRYKEALVTAKEALDSEYNRDGGIIKNNKAYMAIFNALEHEKFRGGLANPDGGDYPLKWMSEREKE